MADLLSVLAKGFFEGLGFCGGMAVFVLVVGGLWLAADLWHDQRRGPVE